MSAWCNACVQIWAEGNFIGSGFFISQTQIITAKHVVNETPKEKLIIKTSVANGDIGVIEKRLPEQKSIDCICLEIARQQSDFVTVKAYVNHSTPVKTGESVFIVGFNQSEQSRKEISCKVTGMAESYKLFTVDKNVDHGMSGSLVLNQSKSVFLGIVLAKSEQETYILSFEYIKDFIKDIDDEKNYLLSKTEINELTSLLPSEITADDIRAAFCKVASKFEDEIDEKKTTALIDQVMELLNKLSKIDFLLQFTLLITPQPSTKMEIIQEQISQRFNLDLTEHKKYVKSLVNKQSTKQLEKEVVLSFVVTPLEMGYIIRYWRWFANTTEELLLGEEKCDLYQDLIKSLSKAFKRAESKVYQEGIRQRFKPTFSAHFFMPIKEWKLDFSNCKLIDPRPPLIAEVPLVVRSQERLGIEDDIIANISYWTDCCYRIKEQDHHEPIYIADDNTSYDNSMLEKLTRYTTALIYTKCKKEQNKHFDGIIKTGIPFAFWPTKPVDKAQYKKQIHELINQFNYKQWPEEIFKRRQSSNKKQAECWQGIQALYDTYDYIPSYFDQPFVSP